MDEPLFKSAHEALVFATHFAHGGVSRPQMNQMIAPSTGSGGNGLIGLDGAAQAGIILQVLNELRDPWENNSQSTLRADVLFARVAPHKRPCECRAPCCSKWTPNWEWHEAVTRIATELWKIQDSEREMGKRGPINNPLLRFTLVAKFFGQGTSIVKIATEFNLTEVTVSNHQGSINRFLKKVEKDSWHELDQLLQAAGIIGAVV